MAVSGPALVLAANGTSLFGRLLPWLIVLIVVVIGGGVVIAAIRRRLREDSHGTGAGFTLHDLRSLHARGELSDEEFARAREAMISRVRSSAASAPEESPADGGSGNTGGAAH